MVALTGAPGGERLIRRGARMAARSHAELVGVHVRSADGLAGPDQELLDRTGGSCSRSWAGGSPRSPAATSADALVRFALSENATQLLMGSSQQSRWAELTQGSVDQPGHPGRGRRAHRRARHLVQPVGGDVDPVRDGSRSRAGRRRRRPLARPAPAPGHRARLGVWPWSACPWSRSGCCPCRTRSASRACSCSCCWPRSAWPCWGDAAGAGGVGRRLPPGRLVLLRARPTACACRSARDAVALVVFVAVAALVSGLVDRLARRSAELARGRAEAEALAALASGTAVLDREALHRLVRELTATLAHRRRRRAGADGDATGGGSEASAGEPVPATPDEATYSAELSGGSMLVISGPPLAAEDRRLLGAFVSQLRLAQSTLRLQAEAASAAGLAEANNVRDAILAAVSHDLRGPLANIKAAATSLLSDDVEWPRDDRAVVLQDDRRGGRPAERRWCRTCST